MTKVLRYLTLAVLGSGCAWLAVLVHDRLDPKHVQVDQADEKQPVAVPVAPVADPARDATALVPDPRTPQDPGSARGPAALAAPHSDDVGAASEEFADYDDAELQKVIDDLSLRIEPLIGRVNALSRLPSTDPRQAGAQELRDELEHLLTRKRTAMVTSMERKIRILENEMAQASR